MPTINLEKCDKYTLEAIMEASQGSSIYSAADEESIRAIIRQELPKGKDFSRIYSEHLKEQFPLPAGRGLFASSDRLKEIFNEEAKAFKESVKIDKEILWEQILANYRDLYWKEYDKRDYNAARKIMDSMTKLLGAEKAQRMLDKMEDKDGELSFKLDFNL